MDYPRWYLRRMFFIAISKGEADRVREWITEGADPNWRTPKKGTPALVRAVRGHIVEFDVVKALLDNGADPTAADALGLTALDHARRRLLKYDGRPRTPPPRSPSLTPGGELSLHQREWDFIDELERAHPGAADLYLEERRRVAERTFDTRGNLERIVPLLESAQPRT